MLRFSIFFLCFLVISSCDNNNAGIIKTKSFTIDFKEASFSGKSVKKGDFINLLISAKDLNDSLVFSSFNHGLNKVSSFLYDSSIYNTIYSEIFENTEIGDSVVFKTDFNLFLKTFFKYNNNGKSINQNQVLVSLRLINCLDSIKQNNYINKLTFEAIKNEKKKLNKARKEWNLYFDDIDVLDNGIYSRLVTKNNYDYPSNDSIKNFHIIDYTLNDLDGKLVFSTPKNKPHYFQKNKKGQLLKGFEILLDKYNSGDSVHAILPSYFAFHEKGAFVSMIPPFTPLMLKLRIR